MNELDVELQIIEGVLFNEIWRDQVWRNEFDDFWYDGIWLVCEGVIILEVLEFRINLLWVVWVYCKFIDQKVVSWGMKLEIVKWDSYSKLVEDNFEKMFEDLMIE